MQGAQNRIFANQNRIKESQNRILANSMNNAGSNSVGIGGIPRAVPEING